MKILVVGVGSIGERHVRCFQKTGRTEVSICESNESLRSTIADRYRVAAYPDLASALAIEKFGGMVIATPAHLHIEMARVALDHRIPVLIEKPLSISMKGVPELVTGFQQAGVFAAVAYVNHFVPVYRKVQEMITAGEIGAPLQACSISGEHFPTSRPGYRTLYYARHETGGGAIQDAVTHFLNLFEWFFGPCRSIYCRAAHQMLPDVTVEDTVAVSAQYGNVLVSHTLNQFQVPSEGMLVVHGTEGSLEARLSTGEVHLMRRGSKKWEIFPCSPVERDYYFIEQAGAFLDCLEGTPRPDACTLAEGAQTLRAICAALESTRTGRSVEISPLVDSFVDLEEVRIAVG